MLVDLSNSWFIRLISVGLSVGLSEMIPKKKSRVAAVNRNLSGQDSIAVLHGYIELLISGFSVKAILS